jgi:hypothetical protein
MADQFSKNESEELFEEQAVYSPASGIGRKNYKFLVIRKSCIYLTEKLPGGVASVAVRCWLAGPAFLWSLPDCWQHVESMLELSCLNP